MDFKQEQLDKRYESLPDDIKNAINSVEIGKLVSNIGSKNGLLIDQIAGLMDEIALVMLGLETTDDFVRNIERELEISRNEAIAITMDINKEIFNPIRSSLQKMQEEENTETEEEYQTIQKPEKNPTITQQSTTPQTPITPQINNTPSQNTEPPVFVAKTIAIPKPEPVAIPAIRPKTLDEAGRFTIEKPPVGIPQYKDESIKKEVILGMIEDEGINDPEPITISVPSYIPEKSNYTPPTPTPTPTPAPVQTNTETPIVKTPPQIEKKSYTVDPYREQI